MNEKQCDCTIEACDIFDFMASHVGLTVIHPGGFNATNTLAESCHLDRHTKVVDIACGKGTSAIYLAERYGCEVVGDRYFRGFGCASNGPDKTKKIRRTGKLPGDRRSTVAF